MATAEPQVDVGGGNVGKVLATFDGNEAALRADRIEKRHGQGTRARPCFDDGRAGEDIAHVGDDAGILRIDDRSAARHRHDVVDLERTQDLELAAFFRDDHLAVGTPNDIVMVESATVGLETTAADENHLVKASLGVANLNAVALGKDASAGGLAKVCGRHRSITLNRHYVKDTACFQLRPWQDTDEGDRG